MAIEVFDKRTTPASADLAAAHLRGRVEAARFVNGEPAAIHNGVADIRARPDHMASLDTQALFGEAVTVYDRRDGWAWVQLARDGYVGYVDETALGPITTSTPTHWISARRAPVFAKADLKSAVHSFLPMTAEVTIVAKAGRYVQMPDGRWLAEQHVAPLNHRAQDWVAVAQACLGAPYLWGGKTPDGLDCSGLVQTGLHATGMACPRDTDMQEKALGVALSEAEQRNLRRGDLVFWKGHVGIMRDQTELLHANAHHMAVFIEPVSQAIARISATGTQVSSIKRLVPLAA